MATPVQITVTVDSSGAVTGISQIGNAATTMGQQTVTAGLKGSDAVAALTKQWEAEQASIAAVNARIKENMALQTTAGTAAKAAQKEAQAAAAADEAFRSKMFAATARSADQAARSFQGFSSEQQKASVTGRLLETQLGISNRALNQVAARSAVLGPLMAAMLPVGIAAAFIPMLVHMGDAIAKAAQEAGGMTEAVKKMNAETIQASQDAFLNPANMDVLRQHLAVVNLEIAANERLNATQDERVMKAYKEQTIGQAILSASMIRAGQEMVVTADKDKQTELEKERLALLTKEAELVRQAAVDQAVISAEGSGMHGFAKLKFEEAAAIDAMKKDTTLSDEQRANKEYAVRYEFSQKRIQLEQQESDKTISLRQQVTDQTLSGTAKILADETAAQAELARMHQRNGTDTEQFEQQKVLIHLKALNQLAAYDRQQDEHVKALQEQAVAGALTGDAAILESGQKRREEEGKRLAQGLEDVQHYNAAIRAINQETNRQVNANDDAEAEKERERIQKLTALHDRAAEDMKTAQEDAALATVPLWQRASASIQIELNRRLRAIEDERIKQLASDKLGEDAVVAINQDANAKRLDAIVTTNMRIREENQRMVESLGSDLQSVFDDITSGNIGKRILANMEKLFFQILAQWILSLGIMKSAAGSILGSIVFGPGSTGGGVFGGGGFGAGGAISLLGGLFGASSTQSAQLPGGGSSSFSLPGLVGGTPSGLGGAIAGTGATATNALAPSASNALTSSTMSEALPGLVGGTTAQLGGKSSGLLGGLFSKQGLAGIAPMAAMALGAAGGKVGMIGGVLGALLLSGKLAPVISSLYGSIGMAATGALAGGALGGLLGFGIGSSHGGLLGSLAGVGSGALVGFMAGGPIGAIIGGLVGLLGGIFGGIFGGAKRKKQANALADNTILPDITQIITGFDGFQVDSSSAIQQLEQLRADSQKQLGALKSQGKDVFNQKVGPAIDSAEKHIRETQSERDRRSALVFGPPQFDTGGLFRTMRGNAGLAVLHDGEMVMNPTATKKNAAALNAMNQGKTMGGSGGDVHYHIYAMDAKSLDGWLKNGGAKGIARGLTRFWDVEGNL